MSDYPTPPIAPPLPPPVPTESNVRMWNMWCHLSALSGLVVPFGNLLGPLLVWQIKKNEIPSVELHGKAALNFQLTLLIATVATFGVMLLLWLLCIGWLLIPVLVALWVMGIVFTIIAGIRANDGIEYRYPFSLKLL